MIPLYTIYSFSLMDCSFTFGLSDGIRYNKPKMESMSDNAAVMMITIIYYSNTSDHVVESLAMNAFKSYFLLIRAKRLTGFNYLNSNKDRKFTLKSSALAGHRTPK